MREVGTNDQFQLSGAWNFRDVGGARTVDGLEVRRGLLYRSSELTRLDARGHEELTRLGVKQVFDLRGETEIERSGTDRVPGSVRVRNVPYDNHKGEKAPHESRITASEDAQLDYMMRAYTSYASLEGARIAIRSVVTALGTGEGPVLVHCAAGKDRAGWTIATVLRAAGVEDAHIVADYLRSNAAVDSLRAHVQASVAAHEGSAPIELSDALLGVTERYYRHGLEAVEQVHGSFDGYLDAIGIDGDDLLRLRSTLLVGA